VGSGERGAGIKGTWSKDFKKILDFAIFVIILKAYRKKLLYLVNFSTHYRGIRSDL
jgi:hypothetical protein